MDTEWDFSRLIVSVTIGLLTGILVCLSWNYGYFSRKRRSSTETSQQQTATACQKANDPKSKQPNLIRTSVVQTSTAGHVFSAVPTRKQEVNEISTSNGDEHELTMKEKFYLFLEKGFCPELEKGVEDPMYKYYGGKNPNPKSNEKAADLFCPFGGDAMVDDDKQGSDDDDSMIRPDTDFDTRQYAKEVDSLEKMIKLGMQNGGQCPFKTMFDKDAVESAMEDPIRPKDPISANDSNSEPVKDGICAAKDWGSPGKDQSCSGKDQKSSDCPFQFGLQSDADSEEEADVPKHHGQQTWCPLMGHENNKAEERGSLPVGSKNCTRNAKQKLKDTLNAVQSSLSKDELEEEAKMRQDQIAAIANLLAAQQDNLITGNASEIQSQLKIYM